MAHPPTGPVTSVLPVCLALGLFDVHVYLSLSPEASITLDNYHYLGKALQTGKSLKTSKQALEPY